MSERRGKKRTHASKVDIEVQERHNRGRRRSVSICFEINTNLMGLPMVVCLGYRSDGKRENKHKSVVLVRVNTYICAE